MRKLIIASTSTLYGGDYLDYLFPTLKEHFKNIKTLLFIPYARPGGITHDEYTKIAAKAFQNLNITVKGIHEFENSIEAVKNADVVIIDTAGRLHNKLHLMDELGKIKRVIQKVIPGAPHEVMLVLDGSTGQNALEQAKQFTATTEVTALSITKLDGTAKGGVVLAIANQFKIPVKYIGVGEKIDDLIIFDKHEFVDSLFKGVTNG